jgi:YVTN family beta-propeller protein
MKSPRAENRDAASPQSGELRGSIAVVRVLAMLFIGMELGSTPVAASPFAYVTNFHSGSVSVIDVATNTVVGNPISVGGNPDAIVITPDGTRAYLVNDTIGSVFVIDTASNTVLGNPIPVPVGSGGIAITPDGTRVYVAISGPVPCCGSVSVIDTANNTVVGSPIPVGAGSVDVAITPDGTRAYVVNEGFTATGFVGTVSVINTATNTVSGSPIPVGIAPGAIAITPDGTRAYVTNNRNGFVQDGTLSVIDTTSNTLLGTIFVATDLVAADLQGIAITPDGSRAYVTGTLESNPAKGFVSVIDTATNTVVGSPIPVDAFPLGIAITSDGTRAYFTDGNFDTVSVIDTTTNKVLGSPIAVGHAPADIAITPGPICTPVSITALQATPPTLWPPNHQMVSVNLSVTTSNGCGAVSCQIINVSSNEQVNGLGDGNMAPDWQVTGSLSVDLRAERSGTGTGRIYTVTVQCTDASGGSATKLVQVTVPFSQRK